MNRIPLRAQNGSPGTARCHVRLLLSMATALAFVLPSVASAGDWPQFRGPNATGVSTGTASLPTEFSFENKVLWSSDLGEGIACPIIAGGRVFATSMIDEQKFAVSAFDPATGKRLWQTVFDTGPLPDITSPNSHASSTPASDGDRVFVHFSTIGLIGLDAADGQVLWKRPVPRPFYLMGWGAAQSPIVYNDLVLFNQDDDLAPFLMAVDKYTGKVRWKTERPEMLGGYSVPVICQAGGQTDVVVSGTGKLKGYNPQTGKERWTCNTLLRTMMTTPAVHNGRIYVSSQSYGDTDRVLKFALLQWKDTNQDGKLERSELDKAFSKKFDQGDKNKDGFLIGDEIDAAFQAPTNMVGGGDIIQAIQGGGTGDVTKTNLLWNLDIKAPSNIVSPLVVDGRLLVVKRGGISACFDIKDGKTVWNRKRIRNLGNYYASPIAGDGKIYVTGENGFIVVLKQGPKLEILAKNDMGDSIIATPAIANGRLYIRTLKKLYCISNEAK